KQGFAAAKVGLELQDYAMVMVDVQDRVGEFLSTGGGPLADFFKQVAPRVGVTADAFRDLSGPQALQKFVDVLEQSGANQATVSHYLQVMSTDAIRLLPLLKDNGEAMEELKDRAEELGIVLSEMDIDKMVQAQRAIQDATVAVQ